MSSGWDVKYKGDCQSRGVRGSTAHFDVLEISIPGYNDVILDTGSTVSILPEVFPHNIQRLWMGIVGPNIPKRLICKESWDLKGVDIAFTFKDINGSPWMLRAPADRFLQSPWPAPSSSNVSMNMDRMCPVTSSFNGPFVLGMNFFWCAFVRYVVPPHPRKTDPPYVQLAPQRVLDSKGSVIGHEEAFKLYQGFPPRMFED